MEQSSDSDLQVLPAREKNGMVIFTKADWSSLLEQARKNHIGRARVCAHRGHKSRVQEMFIAFVKGSYVHPHRHVEKCESFHVVFGELSVIFFNDEGRETDRIALAASGAERPFYFRAERNEWHTVVIESDYAFIHEITLGPYEEDRRLLAPWAPAEGEKSEIHQFLEKLTRAT